MTRTQTVVLVGALALGVGLGCRVHRDNPEHCFHARGDATCLERHPDGSLPFCVAESCGDAPFGCVAELPEPSCYSPCGDEALLGESECELADDETDGESGSDSGTTGDPPDMPPGPECELDSDCLDQEGTLFCMDGSCEPCSSMPDPGLACMTRDPGMPVCHEDECVACYGEDQAVCMAQEQICLPDTTSCGPCTDHDQCPGGAACNILDGLCFPADAVWHVDGDGGRDFLELEDTIFDIPAGEAATLILHELNGGALYVDRVAVSNKTIAVLAAPGEHPRLAGLFDNSQTASSYGPQGLLYLRGVELRGDEGIGIYTQARAHVENSEFYVEIGPAIEVATEGYLVMRNTMVRGAVDDPRVLIARDLGYYDVVNSTLIGFSDEVLSCPSAPKASSLRNSIVVSLTAGADVSGCSPISIHLIDNAVSKAVPNEPDNTVVGVPQANWFVDGIYDLHLTSDVPLSLTTAATWQEGDPLADFDGDPRPIGPDVTDWAGADVPTP